MAFFAFAKVEQLPSIPASSRSGGTKPGVPLSTTCWYSFSSAIARPCPPRADRTRGETTRFSSRAIRCSIGTRKASCARSSTKMSTVTGLLIEHPSQEQALEEAVLRSGRERRGNLVVLEQRAGDVEGLNDCRLPLPTDVEQPDVLWPRAGAFQHGIAEQGRVRGDNDLAPLLQ